jgi:NADH-quinone oxidoreductase subunit C
MRERFPQAVESEQRIKSGLTMLVVKKEALLDLLRFAKDECQFRMLYDLTAADHLEQEPYFHVIYLLHSPEPPAKLLLKVKVERETPVIPSATTLWPMANWFEREVYDFYGIRFEGHPNLKRLLMPDDWMGHPLRKDYALTEEPVQFKGVLSEKLPSEVIPRQHE